MEPSKHNLIPRTRAALICLICLVCTTVFSGCVRRRLFVNSNPVGALVYVDNEQIGTTPCAVDFTYYGTREIRLVKPGFETLTFNQPLPTPWYEIPPLDFVSENLVPTKIRDNRSVTYNMVPQVIVPEQELIARGEQLRQEALQSGVVPARATLPVSPQPVGPLVPTNPSTTFGPPAPASPTLAPSAVGQPIFGEPIPVPQGSTLAPPVVLPPAGPPVQAPQFAPPSATPTGPQRGRPLTIPSPN